MERCPWVQGPRGAGDDPRYVAYHDEEWGRPVTDDRRLYEKLCLEGFQSGLAWITILRKREGFRAAFAGFDPVRVAAFDDDDVARLLGDAGIVRHRGKITATIANARATLDVAARYGSLAAFVWGFAPAEERPVPGSLADLPAVTPESTALSKALRAHGFRFVGPTTAYAFMQAMGLVNDHVAGCGVRATVAAERAAVDVPVVTGPVAP